MSVLAQNLRAARQARGFTMRALAARVGISHNAINKYEAGTCAPASSVLVALGRALEVPVECLFAEEGCGHLNPPRRTEKPPRTSIGRARRWASLWKAKAKEYRAAAYIATCSFRDTDRKRRTAEARVAQLERGLRGLLNAGQYVATRPGEARNRYTAAEIFARAALEGKEPFND